MVDRDNVGVTDTAIRSVVACICLALAAEQIFTQTFTIVLAVVGTILLITSATGVCWLYKILGINTYHKTSNTVKH